MNAHPMPVRAILAAGVAMGFAGDTLLRAAGAPGLNFALLFAGLAASVVLVARSGGEGVSPEAKILIGVGVLFGATFLWRGSPLLHLFAFVAASTAFAVAALHGGRAWVRRASSTELCEAILASGLHSGLGSARLFQNSSWEGVRSEGSFGTARTVARSALRGLLLAALPLVVFGALFISADQVFAGIISDFVRIDLQLFAEHMMVVAILSWLACGFLAGFWSGTRLEGVRNVGWVRPSLGTAEVATALGLVDLLFLGFVIVQFRYLFGGAEWVEVTPGLSYAAYAREGFFQLLAATALGLPWLLAADGLLRDREGAAHGVFRGFAGVQLVLLLAIVASATERMRAYLDAYGPTEDRFVASVVLGWLALVILWFSATVLRGRRAHFAFGTLVSAFALVMLLQVANPGAYAARSDDAGYLASLGSDATPVLLERLDELDEAGRCLVAESLLSRWGPDRTPDWRNWNHAEWRARGLVQAAAPRLRAMAPNLAANEEACEAG